ncbi:hypothetical protein MM1218R_03769 [Mycobacterium marinum]|nr:hypothetical protein MM1218R_03769 [Mycobacterium marinum]RFZ07745.1 hypothetical protein DE4381_02821 [Mycobacterium marinum]RFZ41046.1 hypothetical protein MSS4_05306 [Mycobacterium marinum]
MGGATLAGMLANWKWQRYYPTCSRGHVRLLGTA